MPVWRELRLSCAGPGLNVNRTVVAILGAAALISAAAVVIALRPAPLPVRTAAAANSPAALPQLKPDTGSPVIRPTLIAFSADGGNIVAQLTWSLWDQHEAIGTGTRTLQSCNPNCAQGVDTQVPERLVLSQPEDGYFTTVVASFAGQLEVYTAGSGGIWALSAQ